VLDCKGEDIDLMYSGIPRKHFPQLPRQLALDGLTSLCTEIAMDEGLRHELLHIPREEYTCSPHSSTNTTLDETYPIVGCANS